MDKDRSLVINSSIGINDRTGVELLDLLRFELKRGKGLTDCLTRWDKKDLMGYLMIEQRDEIK